MTEASTWSERLWGIDWTSTLPWTSDSGVVCDRVSLERALPFIRHHYDRIFASANQEFFPESLTEAKIAFYREADIFLFTSEGIDIGIIVAHPTDWNTYYVRTMGVLPEHKSRHVATEWVARTLDLLKNHGVMRFETETAPSNHTVIHILNKYGMMMTGTLTTERWGTLLRYTKLMDEAADAFFVKRYCMGGWDDSQHSRVQPRSRPRNQERRVA
jgi:RimJ/RimL family protein N-acetyltransferase